MSSTRCSSRRPLRIRLKKLGIRAAILILLAAVAPAAIAQDYSLAFDGVDDYLAADAVTADLTADFTFEGWFYFDPNASGDPALWAINGSATDVDNVAVVVYQADAERFKFVNAVGGWETPREDFAAEQWYHVALVWKITGGFHGTPIGEIRLYVDGVEELLVETTVVVESTDRFSVAQEWDSAASNFLPGRVDEVRVWSDVRSQTEIQDNRDQVLQGDEAGLVAYWKLDDVQGLSAGSTTADLTASNHDATLNGFGTIAPAENAASLSFDGTDDFVEGDELTQDLTDALTLEGWFYLDAEGGASSQALFAVNGDGSSNSNRLVMLYERERQQFIIVASANHSTERIGFAPGRWYHIAITVTSSDTVSLYVNGELELSFTEEFELLSSDLFSIGQEWDGTTSGNFLSGKVDDFRAWDVARSQSEIQSGLGTELTGTESGLVSYWKMDADDLLAGSVSDWAYGGALEGSGVGVAGTLNGFTGSNHWTDASASQVPVATLLPPDGTLFADRQSGLTVLFDTPVEAGSGAIRILQGTTLVETIASAASTSVAIDGARLVIRPSEPLEPNSAYTIEIDAGAVRSPWGSDWGGTPGAENWDFTTDPGGSALDLTQSQEQHLEVASLLPVGKTYTFEGWFRTRGGDARTLFALRDSDGLHYMMARVESAGTVRFLHRVPAGSSGGTNIIEGSVDDGNWHHYAAVKTDDASYFYLDGELAGQISDATDINDAVEVLIGRMTDTAAFFDGQIDEFRFWDTARTQLEIRESMLLELPAAEEGLVAYWPFDEGSGTVASDVVGGRDGVLINMDDTDWVADVNPVLVSMSPVDDAVLVGNKDDLVLTFDRDVEIGSGDIRLYEAGVLLTTIDATSALVTLSGGVVAIDHGLTLTPATSYHVEIDDTVIEGNWFGVDDDTSWNFGTDDTPSLTAIFPDGTSAVALRQTPSMSFDQPVFSGSGNITVFSATGVSFASLDVQSTDVLFDDDTVSLSIPNLAAGDYYVLVDDGAVRGAFGTAWPGLSATSDWSFSTVDAPAMVAGSGISFDGDSDYVDVDEISLINTEAGSIEMWIRPTDLSGLDMLVHTGTGDGLGGGTELYLYTTDSGVAGVASYVNSALVWQLEGVTVLETDSWHHIAFVWDAAAGAATLYVDGSLDDSTPIDNSLSVTVSIRLGYHHGTTSSGRAFSGVMDEVRIWDVARTNSQIQGNMRSTLDGTQDGLVTYYQFTDGGLNDPISGVSGSFGGDALSVTSTLPVAAQAASADETPGTVLFGDTGVSATYITQTGVPVYATRIDGSPIGAPNDTSLDLFADEYWVIERFEDGLFKANFEFTVSGAFTADQQAVPEQIKLYRRDAGSEESDAWTVAAVASAVTSNTATFEGIRGFSEFIIASGDVLDVSLLATDGTWEDRVDLSWPLVPSGTALLQITREDTSGNLVSLSYLASDETAYSDATGNPGASYTYCLTIEDVSGTLINSDCAAGSRVITPPTGVDATDQTRTDGVLVTWSDASAVEAGYNVYRTLGTGTPELLESVELNQPVTPTTSANKTSYLDEGAADLQLYTYCVEAVDADDFLSVQGCADGTRGAVLPPAHVSASDGTYLDEVRMTWTDQTSDEDGFNIYGPGPSAALSLNGVADYVRIDGLAGDLQNSHTFELWVKPDATITTGTTCPITINSDTVLTGYAFCYVGQDEFEGDTSGGAGGYVPDRWYHLAIVQDGTSLKYYVDGVEVAERVVDTPTSTAWVQLGSSTWTTGEPRWIFKGEIGDLRVWNTARTSDQLLALMHTALAGTEDDLLALFRFDEASGTRANSVIGNYEGVLYDSWNTEANGPNWVDNANLVLQTAADVTSAEEITSGFGAVHSFCVATRSGTSESVAVCDDGGVGILPSPSGVTATSGTYDDRVEISWRDVSDTEDGFRVYRDDNTAADPPLDDGSILATTDSDFSSFVDDDVDAGADFRYCVVAVVSTPEGEVLSAEDCALGQRAAVLAPTSVSATTGDFEEKVVVNWTNPSSTAALIKIYRTVDGVQSLLKTTIATTASYTDSTIPSDLEADYCVAGVTATKQESNLSCDTGQRSISQPTGVTASVESEEDYVEITWDDLSKVESGYRVERTPTDETGSPEIVGTTNADGTSIQDYEGVPSTNYSYAVFAFDAYGESQPGVDTGLRVLEAPTSVVASDGEFEDSIMLTWKDNSEVETGYVIYRDDAVDPIAYADARSIQWIDDAPDFGATHLYAVAATDGYGESARGQSNGSTMILAPGSVSASDTYGDRVVITWVDRSTIALEYEIRRSSDNGASWAAIGESLPGVGIFTDGDAVANTDYLYCVQSISGGAASVCEDTWDDGYRPESVTYTITEIQQLVPTDAASDRRFGTVVALSDEYAFATDQSGDGGLYIFELSSEGTFEQVQKVLLGEGGQQLGGVSAYGEHVVVADPDNDGGAGRAWVVGRASDGTWSVVAELKASDGGSGQNFGLPEIALNSDTGGTIIAIGARYADGEDGAVYIFEHSGGDDWGACSSGVCTETVKIESPGSSSQFGDKVALHDDLLLALERGSDSVWAFERDAAGSWSQTGDPLSQNNVDFSQIDVYDDTAVIGAFEQNAVYVYERDATGSWSQTSILTENGNRFGRSVAVWQSILVVGADYDGAVSREGVAYTYERAQDGSTDWQSTGEQLLGTTRNEEALFGRSVAINQDRILVGATGDDEDGDNSGAAYLTVTDVSTITEPGNVIASDGVFQSRIQVSWTDGSDVEVGYRLYRDGEFIDQTSADVTSYSDFDSTPGVLHTYCIETVSDHFLPSQQVCDLGYRPTNGSISGQIASAGGAGIGEVDICLDPSPSRALLLDGTGGHGLVDGLDLESELTELTLSTWVRSTASGGTALSYVPGDGSQLLAIRDTGDLRFVLADDLTDSAGIDLADGTWHHVAVTWEGAGGTVVIYIDGVPTTTQTLGAGTELGSHGVMAFGQELQVSDGAFDEARAFAGQLDDIRMWSTVRTEAEINALMSNYLTGDENGLIGYWPLDQDQEIGGVTPDFSISNNHASLVDGAFTSAEAAPIDVCTTTDVDGNYTLADVPYGESTTFGVVPSKDSRQFDPPSKNITLSVDAPVQNEVGFGDVSSFSIAGTVEFEYDGSLCPAPGIEIHTGAPGEEGILSTNTEKDGAFAVALDLGDRFISPYLQDTSGDGLIHTFTPSCPDGLSDCAVSDGGLEFNVDEDVVDLRFLDTTTRELSLFVGGNCSTGIGTVKVRIFTSNGCFEQIVELDGLLTLDLPPQKYFVQVLDLDPPSPLDEADVITFFDDLGIQEVDLSLAADTLDLIYEAPLAIVISGLPSEDDTTAWCAIDDTPGVPIIATEVVSLDLTISVGQDYGETDTHGNSVLCPVEAGSVEIFDEIGNVADGSVVLELENGEANYELLPGTPNILAGLVVDGVDRSYQKPLTATVDVEGRDPVSEVVWAIVEGSKTRTAEFATLATSASPQWILRDPPGDGSSASISAGYTECRSVTDLFVTDSDGKITNTWKVGTEGAIGTFVGLGGGATWQVTTRTTVDIDVSVGGGGGIKDNDHDTWCIQTSETLSTSSSDIFIGEDADVLVGLGFNFVFANADVLSADVSGGLCELSVTETVDVGLSGSDPFSTTYAYTQWHILNVIIPELQGLMDACEGIDYCPTTFLDPADESVEVSLEDAIEHWRDQLEYKEDVAEEALAGDVKNRSFSSGASYTWKASADTTESRTNTTFGYLTGSVDVTNKFSFIGGTGLKFHVGSKQSWENTDNDSQQWSGGYSYTLSDDDIGDSFTVDVAEASVQGYKSPVFALRSGVTSNPWEPGMQYENRFDCLAHEECDPIVEAGYPFTQPRDKPTLSISPSTSAESPMFGVDPDTPALFTIGLGNESESQEQREYILRTIHTSNPHGATLKANGASIQGGLSFFVDPGTTQNVTLEVGRGPSKYLYEDLQVMVHPPGEYSVWQSGGPLNLADTVSFSVQFDAVCSEIAVLRPFDPWTRNATELDETNAGGYNPLKLIINAFRLNSKPDLAVEELGVQYRKSGDASWLSLTSFRDDDVDDALELWSDGNGNELDDNATSFSYTWDQPDDGVYEVRAFTDCASPGGVVYSEVIVGTIDTTPPVPFGQPQPSDQLLNLGDDISIEFNEEMSCSTINNGVADNVVLYLVGEDETGLETETPLGAEVVCDGRRLIISPTGDVASLENETIRARVYQEVDGVDADGSSVAVPGVADLLGNSIAADIAWDFRVSKSAIAWAPVNVVLALSKGFPGLVSANLANGRANTVTFDLTHTVDEDNDGVADLDDLGIEIRTAEIELVDLSDATNSATLLPVTTGDDILSGASAIIDLDIPRTLEVGTYEATLIAELSEGGTALGQTFFHLSVDVLCRLPTEVFAVDFLSTDIETEVVERVLNPANFAYNMTYTAELSIDAGTGYELSVDEGDAVLAFVDGEVRGLDFVTEISPGLFVVNMVVFSNEDGSSGAGETVSFQIWDKSQCLLLSDVDSAFRFLSDDIQGTATTPKTLLSPAPSGSDQAILLEAGWNWFSHNRSSDTGVDEVLSGLSLAENDEIKSHDDAVFAKYTSGAWDPATFVLTPGEGYQLFLGTSGTILLSGTLATGTVDLTTGWNWVGYMPESAQSVDDALTAIVGTRGENDLIKSQVAFAQFLSDGNGGGSWIGSLDTMRPGSGYQMFVDTGGTLTFSEAMARASATVPTVVAVGHEPDPVASAVVGDDLEPEAKDNKKYISPASSNGGAREVTPAGEPAASMASGDTLSVNPHSFRYDMTLTGQLYVDGVPLEHPGVILAATVEDDLRGVAESRFVPALNAHLVFLTVYSNQPSGESVRFRFVDPRTGASRETSLVLPFASNQIAGNPIDPVILETSTATSNESEELPAVFSLEQNYPNPFNPVTTIRYALPVSGYTTLTVHDVLGREVARLVDSPQAGGQYEVTFDAGGHASGVYLYRLESGGSTATGRMLLLKEE